jgi:peptide chain release factor 1
MSNPLTLQLQEQIALIDKSIAEAKTLSADPAMAELATEEVARLDAQKSSLEAAIDAINHPKEKEADVELSGNGLTLEIRPGAGGDEAKIWAEDLMRMYIRYCQNHNFKAELIDQGMLKINGPNAYPTFKYESGVHRVQRVPSTEAQGRIHTSTASIAVLPIIKPQQLVIKDEELEWQFFRSGGAGGQNVNKVNTAVRLTHKPTGLVVTCSSERSQLQNRNIALDLLRSQLWELEEEKRLGSLEAQRKAAVGRAMRAEKIRTYNFPQNRVTDHRINTSWHNLDTILEGGLEKVFSDITTQINSSDPLPA